jgi:hypothetical protein
MLKKAGPAAIGMDANLTVLGMRKFMTIRITDITYLTGPVHGLFAKIAM